MSDIEGASLTGAESLPAQSADATGLVIPTSVSDQSSTGQPVDAPYQPDPNLSATANERIRTLIAERDQFKTQAEQAATYEPYKPFIEHLKTAGINSFDEFAQRADTQRAEAAASAAIEQRVSEAANRIKGEWDAGEIDEATARRTFEAEQRAIRAEASANHNSERLMALEITHLQTTYPKADSEWVRAVAAANPGRPLADVMKASQEREVKREQTVIAQYNAAKATDNNETRQQPASGGASGQVAGAIPDLNKMTQADRDRYFNSQIGK